jgi:hypothetical protein
MMASASTDSTSPPTVLRQEIVGARRLSNYFWATIVSVGGVGFLLAGLSSYLQTNFLPFANPTELTFLPQGLVMGLYGSAAILLALYLWLSIVWNLGSGYNEFNKDDQQLRIFRWGFPGKNRKIELNCKLADVQAVKVALREGLNPKRTLYLRVKGMRDIPLTRVGQPIALAELENQAADLVRFLGVPLEGL